jgi:hypothetical protein
MKRSMKILATVIASAAAASFLGCAAPPSYSYKNVTIAITTSCTDCAAGFIVTTYNPSFPQPPNAGSVLLMPQGGGQGGTTTFTATVTNAPPSTVTWTVYPTPNLNGIIGTTSPGGEAGNPNAITTSGNTAVFSAPSPGGAIYTGAALAQAQALGIPQGDVLLVASVPVDPNNPNNVVSASQLVQTYGGTTPSVYLTPRTPTTPANQTQPEVTVARNMPYAFFGGTVGDPPCLPAAGQPLCSASPDPILNNAVPLTTDNTSIWYVGPAAESSSTLVAGGNSILGTIDANGVYTAPANIPTKASGATSTDGLVVVAVGAHATSNAGATSTILAYAYVQIN